MNQRANGILVLGVLLDLGKCVLKTTQELILLLLGNLLLDRVLSKLLVVIVVVLSLLVLGVVLDLLSILLLRLLTRHVVGSVGIHIVIKGRCVVRRYLRCLLLLVVFTENAAAWSSVVIYSRESTRNSVGVDRITGIQETLMARIVLGSIHKMRLTVMIRGSVVLGMIMRLSHRIVVVLAVVQGLVKRTVDKVLARLAAIVVLVLKTRASLLERITSLASDAVKDVLRDINKLAQHGTELVVEKNQLADLHHGFRCYKIKWSDQKAKTRVTHYVMYYLSFLRFALRSCQCWTSFAG